MIDHGTTCQGEPCTCAPCYTRHEPAPGVHQDIPHLNTQCMGKLVTFRQEEDSQRRCPPYCTAHNHEEMGG